MNNFDFKKYLAENKLSNKYMGDPSDILQNKMKELAGYWPVDIKNSLDRLGVEKFKEELDNLKILVDQYFKNKNI